MYIKKYFKILMFIKITINYFDMSLDLIKIDNYLSVYSYVVDKNNLISLLLITLLSLGSAYFLMRFVAFVTCRVIAPSSAEEATGLCEECLRRRILREEERASALLSAEVGRERMMIMYRAGLLGKLSEVNFLKLKARLWAYNESLN